MASIALPFKGLKTLIQQVFCILHFAFRTAVLDQEPLDEIPLEYDPGMTDLPWLLGIAP